MLEIINTLEPFFEDCYRRINVREYARIMKISPPTASKVLESYKKEGLLKKEEDKQYFYYFANKENWVFIYLSRIYWRFKIENIGLIKQFEKELLNPVVILFGSLSKAEVRPDSDIDLAIFTASSKENLNLKIFENKLKRKIQLFVFKDKNQVRNPELLNNILNGCFIGGEW